MAQCSVVQGETQRQQADKRLEYAKFRRAMTLVVTAVSMTPLLLLSAVLYFNYHAVYESKVIDHLEAVVERHALAIDEFLFERRQNVHMQVDSYPYEQLRDETLLYDRLRKMQSNYSNDYVDLGLVDENGLQMAYAGPFRLLQADYGTAEWFRQAIAEERYISDVFSGMRGAPHFIVTAQGHRTDGRAFVLRATIDFAHFNERVRHIRMGTTGLAFLINRHGEFQTGLRPDEIVDREALARIIGINFAEGVPVHLEKTNAQNQAMIYVAYPLKIKDWILVFQQDKHDAFEHLYSAQLISVSVLLLGGLAIIGTALALIRRMVQRISVAEQDQEVLQKQVVETGKLAAIGELAAGIAHEINNPLAIMVEHAGWIGDLMKAENTAAMKGYPEMDNSLREIEIQGRRCKEITHKLLSFARRTDSRVQETQLNDLIEEVIEVSAQKARYGNTTINLELDPALPVVRISPTEMQQVLLNLVNNAIDAMNKEAGAITIRTRSEDAWAVIEVEDNGQGIPEANMARIFEPFYTTKPVGKGTGLGLSICYGIIDKSGGTINVSSTVGVGTTFTVRLPVLPAVPAAPAVEA
ncbi:MAG TPA: two-component sensor histidine kinase [Desulfovibrio sp.]|nr:two-component sensor histidine kinase [Desulfovibrio sp.]HBR06894.1 two-component sensor histidine kinase [Desulfovibrio sp.]